jgi:hypothetical protein
MKLFLVGPDNKANKGIRDEARGLRESLSLLGHESDDKFLDSMDASTKELLSLAVMSDALLLVKGWQSNPSAVFIVETATDLGIPMFIFTDGKLKPRFEIIGLSGYARAGKDTIGDLLVEKGYTRSSFADYIRKALYTLNPYASDGNRVKDVIDNHGWEGSKLVDPEVRLLLQRLGSDVGRNLIDNDIWVDLVLKNIPDGAKIVFTDCRFPNEAEAIKRFGGELWRVSRNGCDPVNNHISEIALDNWNFDLVLENDGTIESLHNNVEVKLANKS